MLSVLIALLTFSTILQIILVLVICFVLVVIGIIFIKYFKLIFGYLLLFLLLGLVFYAGWFYWPIY